MSQEHDYFETFEVYTDASDAQRVQRFRLACVRPLEHYAKTTTAGAAALPTRPEQRRSAGRKQVPAGAEEEEGEVCATGLRVYEGAQLMAALAYRFGLALLPPPSPSPASPSSPGRQTTVVELGCGCGLAGLSLLRACGRHGAVRVVFTDGSEECLRLVRATAAAASLPVIDGAALGAGGESCAAAPGTPPLPPPHCTFPLYWDEAGVRRLQQALLLRDCNSPGSSPVGLVLGADLAYYRVDFELLLGTARALLLTGRADGAAAAPTGLVVLAHFMRVVDGRRKLRAAAARVGLGIVRVPPASFMPADALDSRGWRRMEAVLLFVKKPTSLSDVNGAAAEDDVALARALLRRREEGTAACSTARQEQVVALAEALRPYTVGGDSASDADDDPDGRFLLSMDI